MNEVCSNKSYEANSVFKSFNLSCWRATKNEVPRIQHTVVAQSVVNFEIDFFCLASYFYYKAKIVE